MTLTPRDLEAWLGYFALLQEIANNVGLEDDDCYNETNIAGGARGV